MKRNKFLEAVDVTKSLLHDFIFMCESRAKSTYFTREGRNKLTFVETILFMLNLAKKSHQMELDDYFKLLGKTRKSIISKQGFSEARKKMKPEAFIKLFDTTVGWYYQEFSSKTFMGFRLFAIDASILEINNSKRLKDAFGGAKGSSIELARAMASCIYDIENNLIVKALITHCNERERSAAKRLLEAYKKIQSNHDLFLFDRGYPSIDFFHYLMELQVKFIIRTPVGYYKKQVDRTKSDQMIELKQRGKDGKRIRIRAIRLLLDSGEEELLLTNIEDNFTLEDFKTLYFKRWGIEKKYDELKNKLQIEKFTGDTPLSIEQDFYATMYLTNMASFIKREADERIAKDQSEKELKWEYVANQQTLIGKMKDNLIKLFLEKKKRKRNKLYRQLLEEIQRCRTPLRPNRKFKRIKGLRANRNGLNQKLAL